MFKERKAAQIAAYFLNRGGGTMPHLKWLHLVDCKLQPIATKHNAMST